MFQSFETKSDPSTGAARLALLREELARRNLDGFLVPLADEHQGEYIPPGARRLAWLTGFAGSAGLAIVLRDEAAIFVDGRYTLQVRSQVDTDVFTPRDVTEEPPSRWLKAAVRQGARIGFDPWLHTVAEAERFRGALEEVGATLVAVDDNPIDAVWAERPAPPIGPVSLYPETLAGESRAEKIARVSQAVQDAGAAAAVLTQPDSIAWLFNIRGSDVPHTPMPLSFAIVRTEGRPQLFIDGRKLSNAVRDVLAGVAELSEPSGLEPALAALGRDAGKVLVDRQSAAAKIADLVTAAGGTVVAGRDPVALPKARKNAAELAATRSAHLRDGAAMVRFLAWLDREAPLGHLDEIAAAMRLEQIRTETGALKDISFETISAAGPNAALPHYHVTTASNRPIGIDEIYLIDSGGQYEDGTTDITRTVIVGTPTAELRDRFTRVLTGHIAVARARFPKGTPGALIDVLARQALWEAGLDFNHGTGHGVGVYLSVHEGPQRISKVGHTPLEPGMMLSNEPGFYKVGEYGIRIENLILVERRDIPGGDRDMMGFETLTLAPIDLRLVDPSLMNADEIAWLDAYHRRVRETLGPDLDGETRAWLDAATRPLG
jgi:Xaa-Pro aminopeptidase